MKPLVFPHGPLREYEIQGVEDLVEVEPKVAAVVVHPPTNDGIVLPGQFFQALRAL
jgi:hypothetical protein